MAKYLKRFDTHDEYTAYTASTEDYVMPNVATCYDTEDIHINPYDYAMVYFTTVAKTSGTISFNGSSSNALSYSTDDGATWSTAVRYPSVTVNAGDKVLWKGTCTPNSSYGIGNFINGTATFDVEGNVMSLLFGDNFKVQTSLVGKDYAFMMLFSGNTKVISAENLSLPAATLANQCYYTMFRGCTSLITAPELPAMTLANSCYDTMFNGCTSLKKAPELPATELAERCYAYMLQGCRSLESAPELPAMTLADNCYEGMFISCTSLTTAPELPATTLASRCYYYMFLGCTSLTSATSVLPATTMAQSCYSNMFAGCTSLATAPKLPANTLAEKCYSSMFKGCTNLNSITCLATDISASDCTSNWLYGVSSSGTFTKNANMSSWTTGVNGIPEIWTVVDA